MRGWSKHKLRGWIPVTERLPQNAGKYLAWIPSITGKGYMDILYYGKPDFINKRDERCFYDADSEWGDVPYDDVIAWMELPEPFNEEVEGSDSCLNTEKKDGIERSVTNREWLAEQIKTLPPEDVYDLMMHIVTGVGKEYNDSRGGVAQWLAERRK